MKTASYSHCHGESSFHIVFGPKYRHDVFGKDEIKTFCEKCFNEVAFKENFEIRAFRALISKFSLNATSLKHFSQKVFISSFPNTSCLYFGPNTIWKLDSPWQWLYDAVFIFFSSEIDSAITTVWGVATPLTQYY